jgi:protoheme IX farnesyltransferase
LPTGRVRPAVVFALAVLGAYFGIAVLALQVNLLTAFLGGLNVVIYVLVYTPLKPLTTFNTLVGAVCGAIPPMMGWAAVTGGLQTGAWTLGAILFVWQMPHFLALAWMYRDDYRRGGMSMLPVLDASGEMTSRTMVLSSLMLAPLGLAVTLGGLAGWISAAANLALAVAMAAMSWRFYMVRTDAMARRVFFASIIYLPIALGVMVIDRGPVTQEGWLRAGRPPISDSIPSLRPEAPLEPHR